MVNVVYNLPEIMFVGGETQNLMFSLQRENGELFDISNCQVGFSVSYFSNDKGLPIITKEASIQMGELGVKNLANVIIPAEDTYELSGRFVYQLTVIDDMGHTDIPGHGIINITKNIHPDYLFS